MADPFLAEVRIMSFNFPPKGWAQCNGQLMPINQNQALFALLGTTYGGNGQVNFALPDLRGRIPTYVGGSNGFVLGQRGGQSAHSLTLTETPQHAHTLQATASAASSNVAAGAQVLATSSSGAYNPPGAGDLTTLHPSQLSSVGSNQAHNNMMPYFTLNFCIALQGIFPSRN